MQLVFIYGQVASGKLTVGRELAALTGLILTRAAGEGDREAVEGAAAKSEAVVFQRILRGLSRGLTRGLASSREAPCANVPAL